MCHFVVLCTKWFMLYVQQVSCANMTCTGEMLHLHAPSLDRTAHIDVLPNSWEKGVCLFRGPLEVKGTHMFQSGLKNVRKHARSASSITYVCLHVRPNYGHHNRVHASQMTAAVNKWAFAMTWSQRLTDGLFLFVTLSLLGPCTGTRTYFQCNL